MKIKTKDMCLCAMFTALTAVGAFIKIPIPVCPFTLQFLFTTMAGVLLGKKLGSLSVLIYIIIGLAGVPVFTQGGGPGYVLIPTFGYIIGFLAGTFVTGAIVEKLKTLTFWKLFSACFTGLLIVYLFGMVYYYIIINFISEGGSISLYNLFLYCFVLTVPGDIVLCIVSAILGKRLIPALKKNF